MTADTSTGPVPKATAKPANRSGIILVLCAPSGTGKTTLTKRLLKEFPRFAFSISSTTRAPREGEQDGKDYHFISKERFHDLREEGYFAEWAEVHGNYYGTPKQETLEMLAAGKDVLFDIDVQGASQLRGNLKQGCYVFILPPSRAELEHRLRGRGTDDEQTIMKRIANAEKEMAQAHWFNAMIVNDDLERAYDELRSVYLAATLSPTCRPDIVQNLRKGWKENG